MKKVNLLRHNRLAAFRAHHHWIEILAAEIMHVQQRPPLPSRHADVAPMHDRHGDRVEGEPFRRQAILIARRSLRKVVIVVFTLGPSLAAVIVVISQAVVSEFVLVAQRVPFLRSVPPL